MMGGDTKVGVTRKCRVFLAIDFVETFSGMTDDIELGFSNESINHGLREGWKRAVFEAEENDYISKGFFGHVTDSVANTLGIGWRELSDHALS